jgi:hypothetical protein
MSIQTKYRTILGLRLAICALTALVFLSGRYPPALAQSDTKEFTDEKFREIDKHLESIDTKVDRQWARQSDVDNRMTHMEGMQEGVGALLTLMVGGSIVIQVRSKK